MSAGDIIDQAVRLYRRNFLPLLRIVIAPSLVAYSGTILVSIGWRNFTTWRGDARVAITVSMIIGGWVLWAIGKAAFYAVLGGSSRALAAHFFAGKPILVREVYRAVRERFWSLIGALLLVGLLVMGAVMISSFFLLMLLAIIGMMAAVITSGLSGWLQILVNVIFSIVTILVFAVSFLLIYSRVVYVPQILMVENKGVFSSIGRSFSLAGGEIRRLGALLLFWFYVGWSVLWLLFIPLGYVSGWIFPLYNPDVPFWYSIAWQTVAQLSEILLMPIFMLGCTLLYLDSRVRKEGFDVEMLANRVLAPPPNLPAIYPLPAAQREAAYSPGSPALLILGLNDYWPTPAPASAPQETLPVNGVNATSTGDQIQPMAEFAPAEAAAIKADAEPFVADEKLQPEVAAEPVAVEFARKTCRWCGSPANVEDRFCRVCGSVF
jgi:hypothetical protein